MKLGHWDSIVVETILFTCADDQKVRPEDPLLGEWVR